MKKVTGIFLGSFCAAVISVVWLRRLKQRSGFTPVHVTTSDLDYQNRSPEELDSAHLLDLNDAGREQLEKLNLNPDSLDRLMENRPYRSKLELVSRMVVSEAEYETIKDKIGVAEGREPVKIA